MSDDLDIPAAWAEMGADLSRRLDRHDLFGFAVVCALFGPVIFAALLWWWLLDWYANGGIAVADDLFDTLTEQLREVLRKAGWTSKTHRGVTDWRDPAGNRYREDEALRHADRIEREKEGQS